MSSTPPSDEEPQSPNRKTSQSKARGNPDRPSPQRVLMLVILYATCSSTLSITNKWAILALPFPGVVTACQFIATAGFVFILGKFKILDVEPLEWSKLVKMAPINIVFYLAIFTNGKVLQHSTVETFIAFRSLTPLFVSYMDTICRGEPLPSMRTMFCLAMITAAAVRYAYDDSNFSVTGYSWAAVYLLIIVTEMVYAKHITSTIGLSTWGLVLYQNFIATILFPIASLVTGEFADIARLLGALTPVAEPEGHPAAPLPTIEAFAALPVLVCCVLGVGISFAGWGTRSTISATQFTVLGVACKLATVGLNTSIWQHHAPLVAQLSIVTCILFSVAYQQSAKRDKALRAKKALLDDNAAGQSSAATTVAAAVTKLPPV